MVTWIETKRDGGRLSDAAIREFVGRVVTDDPARRLEDGPVAALLMAILFRGLDDGERRCLTLAMRDSGEVLRFGRDAGRPVVDKHSTGGVGDKVSLPLAPLLASLGFRVPMVSGRGLGITGGTLDKLESIPGFTTRLERARLEAQVEELGVAMAGQTERMVPADRRLYALRDVTGTVPSMDLIVASILSKKLAEGLEALVLDVKFGGGAFMRERAAAEELARRLVGLAKDCGVRTRALITDMDTPLGRSAGNWLEVKESVACLSGGGPADVRALVVECAAQLLVETGQVADEEAGRARAGEELESGRPLERWNRLLMAQGADMARTASMLCADALAPCVGEVRAGRGGWVRSCAARVVGEVVRDLGGGRLTPGAGVDPWVGVDRMAKPGEKVAAGDVVCRVHGRDRGAVEAAMARMEGAFEVGDEPPPPRPDGSTEAR